MKIKEVESLIELAKENGLAELSYKDKEGLEIKVKMTNGVQVLSPQTSQMMPQPIVEQSFKETKSTKTTDPNLKEITSPFVGTFYRSSSPDTEPYVKQGQTVSSGQVLCIVEAMKIMNEIESDFSGEIVEVCVENETYVEFGQVLFRIRA